jgi:hypothetical protein
MIPRTTALAAAAAALAEGHALVGLVNRTTRAVFYSYRWGNDPWQHARLAPGDRRLHSWQYAPGSRCSPPFRVRLGPAGGVGREYVLDRHAHWREDFDFARRYAFNTCFCGQGLALRSLH